MSALKNLNLPPVPPPLKAITPYLLRADQLKRQEPIIAYWCAYHAAQVGIALKVKDPASRNLLFALLSALEKLKADIGPNEAIDNEEVSSAFVEQFALRVFASADDEDRKGLANRATAFKFLAAATFLEVLALFPRSPFSEANEQKITYAKWKAGNISKAIREGRAPNPGPADSGIEFGVSSHDDSAPNPQHLTLSNSNSSSPHTGPSHLPDVFDVNTPRLTSLRQLPPNDSNTAHPGLPSDFAPPGDWSTAATPGHTKLETDSASVSLFSSELVPDPSYENKLSSDGFGSNKAFEGSPGDYLPVHSPPRSDLQTLGHNSPPTTYGHSDSHNSHNSVVPPPPPPPPPFVPHPSPEEELTLSPEIISKAQKHCRFAISSLDYEDVAQARRELLNALGLLGG